MSAPSSGFIPLEGFTPSTLAFLAKLLGIGGAARERRDLRVSRTAALALVHDLRARPDAQFPGGKWATIQHLEALIGEES